MKNKYLILFFSILIAFILIVIGSFYFLTPIILGNKSEYKLDISIENANNTNSFILIPLLTSGNPDINDSFQKTSRCNIKIISINNSYFYNLSFSNDCSFRLHKELKEKTVIEKYSDHENEVSNFLNNFPKLNLSFNPNNYTFEMGTFYIYYWTVTNNHLGFYLELYYHGIGYHQFVINSILEIGWNKVTPFSLYAIT